MTKKDFKHLFLRFGERSSFNVITNILSSEHRFLKFVWVIAFLGGAGMLSWNLYLNISDYLAYSVVSTYTEGKEKPEFPDVTFCNIHQLNDDDNPEELTWETYSKIATLRHKQLFNNESFQKEFLYIKNPQKSQLNNRKVRGLAATNDKWQIIDEEDEGHSNKSHLNPYLNDVFRDFLSPGMYFANLPAVNVHKTRNYTIRHDWQAAWPSRIRNGSRNATNATLPTLIPYCQYYAWNGSNFEDVRFDCKIRSVWDPDYSRCYSVQLHSNVIKDRQRIYGLSVIMYINNFPKFQALNFPIGNIGRSKSVGVRVSLHSSKTKPRMKTGYSIGPGTETTITIVSTNRTRLGQPYSDTDCTEVEHLPNSTESYSYESCYDVCLQENFVAQCHCLLGQLEFTKNQSKRVGGLFCGNQSLYEHAARLERLLKNVEVRNMSKKKKVPTATLR